MRGVSCFLAMEVKSIVGSVDANGVVQLDRDGQIVSKEDTTLKNLYASSADSGHHAPPAADTVVSNQVSTEFSWLEPWRETVDAAARDTIREIQDRGDIDLDDCPIYEDLKDLRARLRTEAVVDQGMALELIETGRMVLFLCEWDDS